MGEGLFRDEGGGGYEVSSAGTKPSQVRPEAIAVMREIGIDISGNRSKSVDEFAGQAFDFVVTVCDSARDNCPVFPGATKRIHWSSKIRRRLRAPKTNAWPPSGASATNSGSA